MIKYEYVNDAGRTLAERIQSHEIEFSGEAIVFIGALGICVRKILPLAMDKYTDPAVVCVDSTGKWVVPVLCGHVGGANGLAKRIADAIGAVAVITTQSDNAGVWALDTLDQRFGWGRSRLSHDRMNQVIASFVNGRPTALIIEHEDDGTYYLRDTLPPHVTILPSRESLTSDYEVVIVVSPVLCEAATIQFFPRCLHLGVGCQKDAPVAIAGDILEQIQQEGYAAESIASIGTIELKKDEPLLAELYRLLPWTELRIYSAETLAKVQVPNPSEKVFEVTGCYGVAEAAAMMDGRRLLIEKRKGECQTGQNPESTSHYTFALGKRGGHIEIVGAGPGDPELISVRGRRFLEKADLILYAGSLVPRELTLCAKAGAVVRSSADMDLEEQFMLMKEFYDRDCLVVRLHTGDPCIYGAIQEQMAYFDRHGMHYHITPGISSFLAAAAELQSQFTIPERCQTIILTRGEGRTPMPEKEKLHMLASHGSTMCIFLSASIVDEVQQQLIDGGYAPETPVAACYRLTWKDQRIYRGQLKDLSKILHDNHLTLTTMIVVGDAIDNRHGLSKLYDGHFTHLFRKGKA